MQMHNMHMACSLCGTCTQDIDNKNTEQGTPLQESVILKLFPSVCPHCWGLMRTGQVCLAYCYVTRSEDTHSYVRTRTRINTSAPWGVVALLPGVLHGAETVPLLAVQTIP